MLTIELGPVYNTSRKKLTLVLYMLYVLMLYVENAYSIN